MGHYSLSTIRSYRREIRLLLEYYPDSPPDALSIEQISRYLLYCKEVLGSGHSKCHLVTQSASFLFKHVVGNNLKVPSVLYPRKSMHLPCIMSEAEVKKLLDGITNLKHRTIFILIYSAGLRLRELTNLRISDIDSQAMRIKVVQGKGKKDRYTLLSEQVLLRLRDYYVKYKPVEFLFNGWRKGSSISPRTVQRVLTLALKKAGLGDKNYSVHTLRHCFATHLLDNGTDLHAIKELLGHNDIKTTMVYMHLTKTRVQRIVNPYDRLMAQPQ